MIKRPQLFPVAALAAISLTLSACGDGDDDDAADSSSTSEASETPAADATTDDADAFPVSVGDVEIAAQPKAIVSLSPSATEMLFAIGADDQVIAADEFSNYPDDVPTTELSGFEPNVEAILGYEPDLVIASADPGELVSGLATVDVPTIILPAATTLDDTYTQIEQLGVATGHVGDAAEAVSTMQADVDALVAQIPDDAEPLTFYHELDANLFTVTSDTFVGQIYEIASMTSIADEAKDTAGGFPQLSPEFVIAADPDVIFFADGGPGGVTPDDIKQRPGWDEMTAVQEGRLVEVDPDIASRWGPRVVDYLEVVVNERLALQPAS